MRYTIVSADFFTSTLLNMEYSILREDNETSLVAIDRVSGKIQRLQWGHFEDVTKECKRMANSKTKRDCAGAKWYASMQDAECRLSSYHKAEHFESDEQFFDELVKCQIAGAKSYLEVVERHNNWSEPHCIGY